MSLQIKVPENSKAAPEEFYEKFSIDRPGKIVFVGHRLSTSYSVRCIIRRISIYGAELTVDETLDIPANFFLEIVGIRDEIGCTMIRRDHQTVIVGFNMLMDPEFLHHVRRLSFES